MKPSQVIELLIGTMQKVIEANRPLHMQTWVLNPNWEVTKESDIHNCGTAACIVGYASVDPDFYKPLGGAIGCLPNWLDDDKPGNIRASTVDDTIDLIFDDYPELDLLYRSIIGGDCYYRQQRLEQFAANRKDIKVGHLLRSRHITRDNPSAQDALTYLKMCLPIVQKIEARTE